VKQTIFINQQKAIEWGLNLSQAAVFSHLYDIAKGKQLECMVSYSGVISELPAVVDKHDTAYRLMLQLAKLGLISFEKRNGFATFTLLDKARGWK